MLAVKPERTGWRDGQLSLRHREWGWDCPAVDVDFLMIEYDRCKAVALVEYKNENSKRVKVGCASFRALVDLGTRAGVPVFACRYASDFSWFVATGLNDIAKAWCQTPTKLTEKEWVSLLYRIRGRQVPETVLELLKGRD